MKLPLMIVSIVAVLAACLHPGSGCRQRQNSQDARAPSSGDSTSSTSAASVRVFGRVKLSPAPATSLPANARLVVKLQDISLADAPSKLLASKEMNSVATAYAATGDIPFTIEAAIPTGTPFNENSVAVSATLSGDGVSYITDTAYFVSLNPGTFEYRDMLITLIKYP